MSRVQSAVATYAYLVPFLDGSDLQLTDGLFGRVA